ncbi:hypothetical protein NDU88_006735 [Pleurodeles waltl]|uniref:Uncharacterized protein n=1 Tax=Pleurodeles waltl TaxID=8319 RepID=A0AAV7VMR1_PLEWA|nr:hypothetical protein NDU88_006735 [Pleurodeles waltl]
MERSSGGTQEIRDGIVEATRELLRGVLAPRGYPSGGARPARRLRPATCHGRTGELLETREHHRLLTVDTGRSQESHHGHGRST